MSIDPLYPAYLPTRPDGFTPTVDVPYFEAEEPGLRADPTKPHLVKAGAIHDDLTPRIGSEVTGVQLSSLSKDALDEVALLAAERGVLVFRDQDFADVGFDRQLEIVKHYGPLHKHLQGGDISTDQPSSIRQWDIQPERVQSSKLSMLMSKCEFLRSPRLKSPISATTEWTADDSPTQPSSGNLRTLLGPRTNYDLWHVDQTFTPNVPSTTFFWVLEKPASGGGDTVFTSLTAAYEALSPAFRNTLSSLRLLHTSASVGEVARVGAERALREAVSTTHPLIIKHPVTQKPVLFVNPTIARKVEGFLPEESDMLLKFLHDHIKSLDFGCRVKWRKGDVVVWDQRSVAHTAVPDFRDGERRHMVRIIPYGGKPEAAFPKDMSLNRSIE